MYVYSCTCTYTVVHVRIQSYMYVCIYSRRTCTCTVVNVHYSIANFCPLSRGIPHNISALCLHSLSPSSMSLSPKRIELTYNQKREFTMKCFNILGDYKWTSYTNVLYLYFQRHYVLQKFPHSPLLHRKFWPGPTTPLGWAESAPCYKNALIVYLDTIIVLMILPYLFFKWDNSCLHLW